MKRIQLAIEGIVAAALATVACGETVATQVTTAADGGVVTVTSSGLTCASPLPSMFEDLGAAGAVDFMAFRRVTITSDRDGGLVPMPSEDGGVASGFDYLKKGTPCATAKDGAKCNAALASALVDASSGWQEPALGGNALPSRTFVVYTRGDEVGKLTSPAEVAAFLGPIDTIGAARLCAVSAELIDLNCEKPDAHGKPMTDPGWKHQADGSWDIVTVVDDCGPGFTTQRYTVSRSGEVHATETTHTPTSGGAICGRRPEGLHEHEVAAGDLGAYFAEIAWLEAAAVVAFRRIESDLRALDAPAELVDAARRAQADEIRHARDASAIARRFGAAERPLHVTPPGTRDRFAIALENAVEGCVRETYGAIVAAYQARTARDPAIRAFFARIADDEARHAELSHAIAAWLEPSLTTAERATLARARASAFGELLDTEEHSSTAHAPADRTRLAGLPSRTAARTLLEGMRPLLLAAT